MTLAPFRRAEPGAWAGRGGRLLYMHIKRDPAKSYWEGEWVFPPTVTTISIGLPGAKEGPSPESRGARRGEHPPIPGS